jgi:hypothetical protein
MKALLLILALTCTARADEPQTIYESSGTIEMDWDESYISNLSTQTWSGVMVSSICVTRNTWELTHEPKRYSLSINVRNKSDTGFVSVIRFDQDGDIFLREKWIGWDGRLKKFYKLAVPQLYPYETAIPGNQGAQK